MLQTRKIQRTGGKHGSFVVTLPKDWVRTMSLNENAQVNMIIENDNRLTIYPADLDATKLADRGPCYIIVPSVIEQIDHVDATNEIELQMFLRKIICAYLIGHTKIVLKGRIGKNVREYLFNFVRDRLFGLELSSIGKNETIFTMYVHTMNIDEEFTVIKDATNNVFRDLSDLLKSPKSKEYLADFVYHANEIIIGHYFYIVRLLKAASDNPTVRRELGLRSGRDLLGARLTIFNTERIANHARKIVNMLKELQPKIPKSQSFEDFCGKDLVNTLTTGIDEAGRCFNQITKDYPIFKKPDFDSVNKAVSDARTQRDIMISYRDNPPKRMSKVLRISNIRIVVESVGRICEYTSDIGEVALNLLIEDFLRMQREAEDKAKKSPPYVAPIKG